MTTGEIANGRSINASIRRRPGKRPRTSASAIRIPKIAFSGTAIAVTWTVSQKACTAAGVVIEAQTSLSPGSKVLTATHPTGIATSAPR